MLADRTSLKNLGSLYALYAAHSHLQSLLWPLHFNGTTKS